MSPTMAMTMHQSMYTPTSDAMERHEYGITKHARKSSSTGGGRAWSEDEVRAWNVEEDMGSDTCGVGGISSPVSNRARLCE